MQTVRLYIIGKLDYLWSQLYGQIRPHTDKQLGVKLNDQLDRQLRGQLDDQIRENIKREG